MQGGYCSVSSKDLPPVVSGVKLKSYGSKGEYEGNEDAITVEMFRQTNQPCMTEGHDPPLTN